MKKYSSKTNLSFLLVLPFLLSGIAACTNLGGLASELSADDEIALEGMEAAMETAETYNDSIIWCIDVNMNCTEEYLHHLDSLFHHAIDDFDEHHDHYSHNNVGDDHHHSATPSHDHGNGMHPDDHMDDHYEHNIESHHEMNELIEHHEGYHPE